MEATIDICDKQPRFTQMTHAQINLTDRAARRIVEIAAKDRKPPQLRIAVNGGGCSGFQYEFTLDAAPQDGDLRVEREGAALLVDSISLVHMAGATVDFVDDLMGQSFRIANPLAKSSCGCGTSFSL